MLTWLHSLGAFFPLLNQKPFFVVVLADGEWDRAVDFRLKVCLFFVELRFFFERGYGPEARQTWAFDQSFSRWPNGVTH